MRMIGMATFIDPNRIKPEHVIPKFWHSAMPRISDISDVRRPFATIGLYQYKPPFGSQQDYQYVAGVEVEMESGLLLHINESHNTTAGASFAGCCSRQI